MRTIRLGVFETNSSSTHSLTMCMKDDFLKWKDGEMYWHRWNDELVNKAVVEDEYKKLREEFISKNTDFDENDEEWKEKLEEYINEDKIYYTYDEFHNYNYLEYETFEQEMKTKNGEEIVAFGYYGYDG